MIRVIRTIDAHVGGQSVRLVVEGVPRPHGKTPAQQREVDASRGFVQAVPRPRAARASGHDCRDSHPAVRGRPLHHTVVGDFPALVTEVEGSAWITGEHTFFLDDDDPLVTNE